MPGATDIQEQAPILPPGHGFRVFSQRLELDFDFATRSVRGKTEIKIQPTTKELKSIRLNCRQCSVGNVWLEDRSPTIYYDDLYERLTLHPLVSIRGFHRLRARADKIFTQKDEELTVSIPKSVAVEELDLTSAFAEELMLANGGARDDANGPIAGEAPSFKKDDGPMYKPLHLVIEFEVDSFRDGLYFAGLDDGYTKYPHVYTRNSPSPGQASCLFPCVDTPSSKCTWEISIRCPRTLGDAFPKNDPRASNAVLTNGARGKSPHDSVHEDDVAMPDLDDEEKSLDFVVICSGDMTDEIEDPSDNTKKTVSFICTNPVAPSHIGFAIGPFEHIDLSEFRDSDQDEKLGQNAIRVHGFTLPGRTDEVRNTCMSLASAIDFFTMNFGSYPFSDYKMCFVEDMVADVADTASLSICSTRLLFPEEILDPLEDNTRTLTNALASQWLGVHVGPLEPEDWWLIIGGALYMTDMFLQQLLGKNDYRFRQKLISDKVAEMDHQRPSVRALGRILHIEPGEMEFMKLKAPAIFFILNQRLIKASGRNGVTRCLHRLLLNAKTGQLENNAVSTDHFFHICEKIGHMKLESFATQWVHGAGCPHFFISQRFNKKKMHVELQIKQMQMSNAENQQDDFLTSQNFMREVKEERHEVYAGPTQPVFSGPMTIRIHEADGTPYEHIIEIRESFTKAEIPYYTKYKRLKRSKRQKERAAAAAGVDVTGDTQDDVLIYCLGDVLQTQEEMRDWQLTDWPEDDEAKMGAESYEWIRIDADFEWLGKIQVHMEDYMFVSQLQQDKDVVAQVDSVRWLSSAHKTLKPLYATFLTRTLLDTRYFHGIRTMAASALVTFATSKDNCQWVGKYHLQKAFTELYCSVINGQTVARTNDFSDRRFYLLKIALIKAMARIRGHNGKAPVDVAKFILDRLKDNDNSNNEFNDNNYVATLMDCLAKTLSTYEQSAAADDDLEAEAEHHETHISAIGLIDRFKRSDEWIPSYRNVYTTTALQCHVQLMEKGVMPHNATEFMQYARAGNSDAVRLKAFSAVTQLGLLKFDPFAQYMLSLVESEPSPYVRDQLHQILHRGIGQIASGELMEMEELIAPRPTSDGFEIEHSTDATPNGQIIAARKKSLDVAKAAAREELGSSEAIQTAMERALRSNMLSINEVTDLTDVCALLYEAEDKLLVKVSMPRYWRVAHHGEGRLVFKQTDKVRWENKRPKPLPPPPIQPLKQSPPPAMPFIEDKKPPIASLSQPIVRPTSGSPAPHANGVAGSQVRVPLKLKIGRATSVAGLPSATTPSTPALPTPAAPPATHKAAPTPPPVRQSPAPSVASSTLRKSKVVKLKVAPKHLKKLNDTVRTNGANGTHTSRTPSSSHHLPPPPVPSFTNSKKRSPSVSSTTATAAAAAMGWATNPSSSPSGGLQPPAKKIKFSPGHGSESPVNSRPPANATPAPKPAFADAAAALMGGAVKSSEPPRKTASFKIKFNKKPQDKDAA